MVDGISIWCHILGETHQVDILGDVIESSVASQADGMNSVAIGMELL